MEPVLVTYAVYLILSTALTIWVSRVLGRHGERFLADVFPGDETLARAVNQLLLAGFYLLSFGYVALTMRVGGDVLDTRTALEELVTKLGVVSLGLGVLHFVNMLVLGRLRRRHLSPRPDAAPVPPPTYPAPPPPWSVPSAEPRPGRS
jgi:hypothetical protein